MKNQLSFDVDFT